MFGFGVKVQLFPSQTDFLFLLLPPHERDTERAHYKNRQTKTQIQTDKECEKLSLVFLSVNYHR